MIGAAKELAAVAVFVAAVLFFATVVSCNIGAILRANVGSNPPNTWQFADGWKCTCDVFRQYRSYFFTSPVSDTTEAAISAVQ